MTAPSLLPEFDLTTVAGVRDLAFVGMGPSRPVIFALHGCPALIHRLTTRRAHHHIQVRGSNEESTGTPFNLVMDVIDRVPSLKTRAAHLRTEMVDNRARASGYAREHVADLPDISGWIWAF